MRSFTVAGFVFLVMLCGLAIWQISESGDISGDVRPTDILDATPGPEAEVESFRVLDGEGANSIGERLVERKIVGSVTQFRMLVALMGYESLLQPGNYEFQQRTSVLDAVQRIRFGRVATRVITVIEGWRLEQIAGAVERSRLGTAGEFMKMAVAENFDYEFLDALPPDSSLEGYLYPATYIFNPGVSVGEIIEEMLNAFDANVSVTMRQRAREAGLSLHEVVSLASIIEREARVEAERPVMAQVFLRRLREGIRLEADPTVQYALGNDTESVDEFGIWKTGLTLADYDTASPYNTYVQLGLPPGPISSPRLASMLAVLNPASTNYLYFVARPDGSHAFAESFAEHQANVEKFTQ